MIKKIMVGLSMLLFSGCAGSPAVIAPYEYQPGYKLERAEMRRRDYEAARRYKEILDALNSSQDVIILEDHSIERR